MLITLVNFLKRNKNRIGLALLVILILGFLLRSEDTFQPNPADFRKSINSEKKSEEQDTQTSPTVVEENVDIANTVSGDLDFSRGMQDFYSRNPWYKDIPIEKENYRVIYDFQKDSFRIRFKTKEGYLSDNEIKILTQQALEDIKNIGATPTNYYILYESN